MGENCTIGYGTIVHDNVRLGKNVVVGEHCVIGSPFKGVLEDRMLVVGDHSTIRSHSVLYEGSKFGDHLQTGHHTLIREKTVAGCYLKLGSFGDIEGDCTFGDYLNCHSYVHIGRGSKIGHFVWIFPSVTLTNDPLPPSHILAPVTLEDGVVVCTGSVLMPGAVMRTGSFAGAQCQVKGDIPPGMIVVGFDCRQLGHVTKLVNLEAGLSHPWMNHFSSRYPSESHTRIRRLAEAIEASRPRR